MKGKPPGELLEPMARRSQECQLLDNSHRLAESELVDEEEEEGESVYLMLNLDWSLPFPGTFVKILKTIPRLCLFSVWKTV